MHKIRGQSYFLKHATSDQSDKTFLLPSKNKNCPQGLSPLVLGLYIHLLNKTKYHIKYKAEGIFLELVQNDGNNKSFKMLPELVPNGCAYAHALGLFSYDDPGLT